MATDRFDRIFDGVVGAPGIAIGPAHVSEAGALQVGDVRPFVAGVGDGQVDIDDRLGGQAGHRSGADVIERQHPVAERSPDPFGDRVVDGRPGRVVLGDHHRLRLGRPVDPDVGRITSIPLVMPRDVLGCGHGRVRR